MLDGAAVISSGFRHWRVFAPLALAVALSLCAPRAASADLAAEVSARVGKVLDTASPKKATIGIELVALGEGTGDRQTLFERAADRAMLPASNLKLITAAAALDTLGKDFKFRTQLLIRRPDAINDSGEARESGEVELAVIGDGDPSFGDAELLRGVDGWETRTVFKTWADLLRRQGITRVTALHLDDGVFDDEYAHPNWPDNQRHQRYAAQVGGLNLNANCLDVYLTRSGGGAASLMNYRLDPPTGYVTVANACRRGGKNAVILTRREGGNAIELAGQTNARQQGPIQVTVHDPVGYFGTVFAEVLAEAGIDCAMPVVDRTIRAQWKQQAPPAMTSASQPTTPPWQLLAVHQTEMAPVLARTNKDSMNVYAEALAKRTAFAATGAPGSWSAAEQVAKAYLARIGADADLVRLDDGCGLSREDRVTASVLCDVLAAQHYSDSADTFRDSLSEAGVDGTLRRRFRVKGRDDLHGRVFGKTGYISGVCTFSGYLHGRDGRWYAFSILVNDSPDLGKAQQLQEEIILALDRSLQPVNEGAVTAGAG